MKLIILQSNLKNGLETVGRATADNNNLPILKNILIKTYNNKIKLSATNLELAVTNLISGKIIEEGGITVPFSVLSGIVNNCDSDKINLEVKNNVLNFKTDNYEANIQGLDEEDFPIIPKIENDKNFLSINFDIFKEALLKVLPAIQISDIRPEISGLLFDFQLTNFKLVGTDSFRLAEKTILEKDFKTNFPRGFKSIIPLKTIQEVVRVVNKEDLNIYIDPNQILFKNDELEIISRLIDGYYPDYEAIIPKELDSECSLNRELFSNAVKLVSNFTGKVNDIKIRTKEGKKTVEIYSANQYFGENNYLIPTKIKGDDFEISYNWRYLLEGLKNFNSEELIFSVNGDAKPTLIKSAGDSSYFYLLMPIKS
ncbi:MAG: DNA polymerase III subunit beta [bacterium]|nr:DNA polymerase III subunit beta [bacterium]